MLQTGNRDKPSETLQLMGGRIDDMGNRILGIDDGVSFLSLNVFFAEYFLRLGLFLYSPLAVCQ